MLAVLLAALTASSIATCAAADPPVPPDRHLGGIPVAVIGSGIDYTADAIASRLARDGEGEIIGYDFVDDDRRPFAPDNRTAQDISEILLGEGQTSALVVVRADTNAAVSLRQALAYAAKSPARVVLIQYMPHEPECMALLVSAIRYFQDRLFVVAAGDESRDLDQENAAGLRGLANALIVSAALPNGDASAGANKGALTIDAATTGSPLKGEGVRPADDPGASMRAAAHIAAMAVRLRAVEPALDANAMKSKIVAFANQPDAAAGGTRANTVYGIIERPERYFWLE